MKKFYDGFKVWILIVGLAGIMLLGKFLLVCINSIGKIKKGRLAKNVV